MRRLVLLLVFAALLPVRLGSAAPAVEDQGIIIRVVPPRLVIRELDGTRMRFVVRRSTVITLDGRRVRLRALRRGDVAVVDHLGRLATRIEAVRP